MLTFLGSKFHLSMIWATKSMRWIREISKKIFRYGSKKKKICKQSFMEDTIIICLQNSNGGTFFLIVWELATKRVGFGRNLPWDPGSQDPTFCGLWHLESLCLKCVSTPRPLWSGPYQPKPNWTLNQWRGTVCHLTSNHETLVRKQLCDSTGWPRL